MRKAGSPSLAENWRLRLAAFEARLSREPEEALVWQTRIEIKVLRFLLARYPEATGLQNRQFRAAFVSPLAFIASPKARPVARERRKLLRHIALENAAVRTSKPSLWEQSVEDFDRLLEAQIYRIKLKRQEKTRLQEQKRDLIQKIRELKW